jgi:hypothetical protein
MPPGSRVVAEEVGVAVDQLDPEAFPSTLPNADGVQLATLDTLQHGLAGDAQGASHLLHGDIAFAWRVDEAGAQVVGNPDAPRCARRELLAGDDAVIEPSMDSRGGGVEDGCGLADVDQFAIDGRRRQFDARDIAPVMQTADMVGGETVAAGRGAFLTASG